jgi:hypothetical protein
MVTKRTCPFTTICRPFFQQEDNMASIVGFDPATSGQQPVDDIGDPISVGVWGDSNVGVGVFGTSGVPTTNLGNISILSPAGVIGHSLGDVGVWGESILGSGVVGRGENSDGVLGVTFSATDDSAGVFGTSIAGGNGVVGFVGSAAGVVGNSIRGTGVEGITGAGNGVVGESFGLGDIPPAAGVFGRSDTFGVRGKSILGVGVLGESDDGPGVKGFSKQQVGVQGSSMSSNGMLGLTFGLGSGVAGLQFTDEEEGSGVFGESVVGAGVHGFSSDGIGVRGQGGNYAGVFLGRVLVTGQLLKGGGGFMIDHPLDPETKYLRHSFVESPDMLNVYNGNITTDANGEAHVSLPHYFEALNHDFRYQLTVIGQFARAIVLREIADNGFTIKTDQPRVKVSWQVTGIRRDAWAAANRVAVEEEKAAEDKGRYLHPEVRGQSKEAQILGSQQHETQLRRVCRLAPERLSQQIQRHMQARSRGDRVEDGELRRLVREARRLAERHHRKEPPRIDHSRLQQQWQRVQELVQRMSAR